MLYQGSADQLGAGLTRRRIYRGDFVIWANDVEIPVVEYLFKHVVDCLFGCPWGIGLVFTARSAG